MRTKKELLKKNKIFMTFYMFFKACDNFFRFRIITFFISMVDYLRDIVKYKKTKENYSWGYLYPCLLDNTKDTYVEPTYFFQDTWAAQKVFDIKPNHHVDVGSNVKTVGIISQFVPTTMVDIRPPSIKLSGLNFVKGDILNLPFQNNSVESISTLCVVEHIGLGRYGDEIIPYGSEKAIKELQRVLAKEGHLLISLPISNKNKVFFNANRSFERSYILKLFKDYALIEEKYIYGNNIYDKYQKKDGIGCFLFKKTKL